MWKYNFFSEPRSPLCHTYGWVWVWVCKWWGGVRFSSVKTLHLLYKELDTCLILGAKRIDICINWKLSRGEFSKKRPKLGLWCKNDKSFEKQLSPPAFQVLACRETTQRELIKKKTFKNWNFSCKLPKMSLCLMEFYHHKQRHCRWIIY